MKNSNNFEAWKLHRSIAYVVFMSNAFIGGVDYAIYWQTEYFYFKDTMALKDPSLLWACKDIISTQ